MLSLVGVLKILLACAREKAHEEQSKSTQTETQIITAITDSALLNKVSQDVYSRGQQVAPQLNSSLQMCIDHVRTFPRSEFRLLQEP